MYKRLDTKLNWLIIFVIYLIIAYNREYTVRGYIQSIYIEFIVNSPLSVLACIIRCCWVYGEL